MTTTAKLGPWVPGARGADPYLVVAPRKPTSAADACYVRELGAALTTSTDEQPARAGGGPPGKPVSPPPA
jgi:hypothetical protein